MIASSWFSATLNNLMNAVLFLLKILNYIHYYLLYFLWIKFLMHYWNFRADWAVGDFENVEYSNATENLAPRLSFRTDISLNSLCYKFIMAQKISPRQLETLEKISMIRGRLAGHLNKCFANSGFAQTLRHFLHSLCKEILEQLQSLVRISHLNICEKLLSLAHAARDL